VNGAWKSQEEKVECLQVPNNSFVTLGEVARPASSMKISAKGLYRIDQANSPATAARPPMNGRVMVARELATRGAVDHWRRSMKLLRHHLSAASTISNGEPETMPVSR